MRKKLLKALIRLSILFAVFVVTMIITSGVVNKGNTDLTADMRGATLPIIHVNINGEYINCLHGYLCDMEGSYLRGTITPMSAERTIPIKIRTFDSVVTEIGYEVRTMDMERLLENGTVEGLEYFGDEITANIPVKDLIDEGQEYMLIVKLGLSDGRVASYYCRFIDRSELYLTEKLDFVHNFSSKTFDKEAAVELKEYMESNAEGDNTSYGYVNIHSSFNQLTWGDLEPVLENDREIRILDIDPRDASIKLNYTVSAKGEMYDVEEFFHLTRGKDRIYLMDYERTMDKIIDEDNTVVANGKIFHGILSEPIDYMENEDAKVFSFVQQRALYSYNSELVTLTRVFSFRDKNNDDVRTSYKMHNIKTLKVDNTGNMFFTVYGYMNRGEHEGETGIAIYYYDSVYNTIEERMFIPYTRSYEMLKHDIDALCYVNRNDIFYIMFNGTIYSVDLESGKAELLASGLNETRFVSSEDGSMIGWQPSDILYDYDSLRFMSLETMNPVSIDAQPGHILLPLGFFNYDFVYGSVRVSDIRIDGTGRNVLPIDHIYIQSFTGEILKDYHHDGIYITDVEFKDNMIDLTRVVIDGETQLYYQTTADQIMNSETVDTAQNKYTSVVTEEMETTWQTELKNAGTKDKIKIPTTKQVLYEGDKYFYLNVKDMLTRYYVYSKGEIVAIYTDPSEAVYVAEEEGGIVTDKTCRYIWNGSDRLSKNSMEISNDETAAVTGRSTVASCLDEMLKSAGIYADIDTLMTGGKTPLDIMKDNLKEGVPLSLSGCSTNAMIYYLSNSFPVMAMVEDDNAVLIVGYDENNLYIYDPLEGKVAKKGIKDSGTWFAANGNRFLTYVK